MAISMGNTHYGVYGWAADFGNMTFDNNGSILVAMIGARSDAVSYVETVKWDGVTMDIAHRYKSSPGVCEIWYMVNAKKGSYTLRWDGVNMGKVVMFAYSLDGVHLGDPIGDTAEATNIENNITLPLLTFVNNKSVAMCVVTNRYLGGAHYFTWNGGTTELHDIDASSELDTATSWRNVDEATASITAYHTDSKNVIAGCEIKAAAGGSRGYVVMSKMREFFEDIKRGLVPPDELRNRYRGLKEQGLLTI